MTFSLALHGIAELYVYKGLPRFSDSDVILSIWLFNRPAVCIYRGYSYLFGIYIPRKVRWWARGR